MFALGGFYLHSRCPTWLTGPSYGHTHMPAAACRNPLTRKRTRPITKFTHINFRPDHVATTRCYPASYSLIFLHRLHCHAARVTSPLLHTVPQPATYSLSMAPLALSCPSLAMTRAASPRRFARVRPPRCPQRVVPVLPDASVNRALPASITDRAHYRRGHCQQEHLEEPI